MSNIFVFSLVQAFENVQSKNKAVHEKVVKALELCQYLVKTVKNQVINQLSYRIFLIARDLESGFEYSEIV